MRLLNFPYLADVSSCVVSQFTMIQSSALILLYLLLGKKDRNMPVVNLFYVKLFKLYRTAMKI